MSHKVLLVDDDENLLSGLRRSLRREPYELITATSPAAAMGLLREHPVSVVVSDERMPGMTGTRFLAEVRRLCPSAVGIMLTGMASLETAVKAINEGEVFRLLTKPCDAGTLGSSIRQALLQRELLVRGREAFSAAQRRSQLDTELERAHPGIGDVRHTSDGCILIDDDSDESLDGALRHWLTSAVATA